MSRLSCSTADTSPSAINLVQCPCQCRIGCISMFSISYGEISGNKSKCTEKGPPANVRSHHPSESPLFFVTILRVIVLGLKICARIELDRPLLFSNSKSEASLSDFSRSLRVSLSANRREWRCLTAVAHTCFSNRLQTSGGFSRPGGTRGHRDGQRMRQGIRPYVVARPRDLADSLGVCQGPHGDARASGM
jgi:hypothetical protein